MVVWIAHGLALAAPAVIGLEVAIVPSAGTIGRPEWMMFWHLEVPHRGALIEVRCAPVEKWCEVQDGQMQGRKLPLPEADPESLFEQDFVGAYLGGYASTDPAQGVVLSSTGVVPAPLVRSDLAGDTSWGGPLQLTLVAGGALRWSDGAPAAFAALPTQVEVTMWGSLVDRWRCDAARASEVESVLGENPPRGLIWVTEAEARCGLDLTQIRSTLCAKAVGEPGVEAWCSGMVPGQLFSGAMVRGSTIEWKSRRDPDYPADAPKDAGDQACKAKVSLNEAGFPVDVSVSGCAAPFDVATRDAIRSGWRAYPYLVDGVARPVQTVMMFQYRKK